MEALEKPVLNREYVLIAPFSSMLNIPAGKMHPKHYPYWPGLVQLLDRHYDVIQLGRKGEQQIPLTKCVEFDRKPDELKVLVRGCKFWVSIDTWLPHFVVAENLGKPGVVLFGLSDPNVFGYGSNLNILRDHKYLRHCQFQFWWQTEANPEAWLSAQDVFNLIVKWKQP